MSNEFRIKNGAIIANNATLTTVSSSTYASQSLIGYDSDGSYGDFLIKANNTTRFRLGGSTGNITFNNTAGNSRLLITDNDIEFNNAGIIVDTSNNISASNFVGTSSFARTASVISSTGNAFVQGGNSFGATGTIGTNDANSLVLKTNNTTQATINSGGRFGIGITPDNRYKTYISDTHNSNNDSSSLYVTTFQTQVGTGSANDSGIFSGYFVTTYNTTSLVGMQSQAGYFQMALQGTGSYSGSYRAIRSAINIQNTSSQDSGGALNNILCTNQISAFVPVTMNYWYAGVTSQVQEISASTATGSITNLYHHYASTPFGSTTKITTSNAIGLTIDPQNNNNGVVNGYGVAQNGYNDYNLFAGKTSIGTLTRSSVALTVSGSISASAVYADNSNVIDVKKYGAIGNGTADDTAAVFAALAVQQITGSSTAYGPRTLYFPSGIYNISQSITQSLLGTVPLKITGDGILQTNNGSRKGTLIRMTKNNAPIIDFSYNSSSVIYNNTVTDISLGYANYQSASYTGSIAINLNFYTAFHNIKNVFIGSNGTTTFAPAYGINASGNTGGTVAGYTWQNYFDNIWIGSYTNTGIYLNGGTINRYSQIYIQNIPYTSEYYSGSYNLISCSNFSQSISSSVYFTASNVPSYLGVNNQFVANSGAGRSFFIKSYTTASGNIAYISADFQSGYYSESAANFNIISLTGGYPSSGPAMYLKGGEHSISALDIEQGRTLDGTGYFVIDDCDGVNIDYLHLESVQAVNTGSPQPNSNIISIRNGSRAVNIGTVRWINSGVASGTTCSLIDTSTHYTAITGSSTLIGTVACRDIGCTGANLQLTNTANRTEVDLVTKLITDGTIRANAQPVFNSNNTYLNRYVKYYDGSGIPLTITHNSSTGASSLNITTNQLNSASGTGNNDNGILSTYIVSGNSNFTSTQNQALFAQTVLTTSGSQSGSFRAVRNGTRIDNSTVLETFSSNIINTYCTNQVSASGFNVPKYYFGNLVVAQEIVGNTFTGSITNAYYNYFQTPFAFNNQITMSNVYGLYIETLKTSSNGVTNAYGIYQVGSSDYNILRGNTSIGTFNTSSVALTVNGAITASSITASINAPVTFNMPFSSSGAALIPTTQTGSAYFQVSGGTNLLFIYNGTRWTSASLA